MSQCVAGPPVGARWSIYYADVISSSTLSGAHRPSLLRASSHEGTAAAPLRCLVCALSLVPGEGDTACAFAVPWQLTRA